MSSRSILKAGLLPLIQPTLIEMIHNFELVEIMLCRIILYLWYLMKTIFINFLIFVEQIWRIFLLCQNDNEESLDVCFDANRESLGPSSSGSLSLGWTPFSLFSICKSWTYSLQSLGVMCSYTSSIHRIQGHL